MRESTLNVLDEINNLVDRQVQGMERVAASALGLDDRCGRVYIDRDDRVIVVEGSRGIDYYGGFEYIKEGEGRVTVGDYTFYMECDRVEDCFECLEDVAEEAE
jgi:hypothetical protein